MSSRSQPLRYLRPVLPAIRFSAHAAPVRTHRHGVTKRNGEREPVDVNKIVRAVSRCCEGLHEVDAMRVALKTIAGLYDGATTRELDELSIRTAASFIAEEPQYSQLAARLLANYIDKEVQGQDIHSFSQSIRMGFDVGLINERVLAFVETNARKLNAALDATRTQRFEYFGLRTLYDRYLLKHPTRRQVIETPQQFWLRIAVALSASAAEALELYERMSSLEYVPSSPTLFNAGTRHEQLSSCFLLDSPQDSLESIYDRYKDIAMLSKFSGGIGLAFHRVRSEGSLIRATNGHSNGIVPWLKTLDSSVAAVNQGGKRKGAACVYLEPWHADIESFLELRDNTGDEAAARITSTWPTGFPIFSCSAWSRAACGRCSIRRMCRSCPTCSARPLKPRICRPKPGPGEEDNPGARSVRADDADAGADRQRLDDLQGQDAIAPATRPALSGQTVHLSNLCTEILEVTHNGETAVCNLGSINLARHVGAEGLRFRRSWRIRCEVAVRQLDRVIDLNYYPIETARASNMRWRPVGLGVMGLQDVFFRLRLSFDSIEARKLSTRIQSDDLFPCAADFA